MKKLLLHNKSLGSYSDVSKYKCPIYSGITLFEIMVHEGIHQGFRIIYGCITIHILQRKS